MVCLSFKLLVLLMVAFASGKSLDKGKRKIEKVTVKLDNLFDKSNAKQTKTTMDVGFLVENPYKHGKHGFAKSLEFVKSLSKSLQVSDIGNHVGLVTYGKHPYMAFDLNEHFTSSEVENAIKGVPSPSYGSNTGRALMFAKKQLFDSSSRPESRKSLIVLTSKRSTDKVNKAADVLKKSDVTVYTIGVDAKDHMVELNDVASDPIEKHKFLTTSSHLQDMVKQIKDLIWKDGQIIPQVLPPNTESRKTKSTVFLKKSKASDEQPQSRSTVEDSGRILDLGNVGNVENPAESQDELDDGNPQSSPAEPTSLPFEDQDIEPTMAPDSLPHESKKRGSYREKLSLPDSSNQAAEFIVSQNPTISTGPREDNPTQQVAPEETESTATTEIVPEKLFMPTVPSSTPAPLPTKQEKLSMPTVSSSTPAPLPIKQEKLSMPAVPSSTPAPLPNKQEKLSMPTVPSSTPAPLPNKQEKLSMPTVPSSTPAPLPNKQVKLSMPTVPLSTPAPLPNKQASTEVENKTASLISTHFLTPTKPETEKPDASSKSKPIVVASPTKPVAVTVAAPYLKAVPTLPLFFANKKKKPTMPAKGASNKPNKIDLAFVIQGLGAMSKFDWMRTMTLVAAIVGSLPIHKKGTRVGINMESSNFHVLVPFFQYTRRPILLALTKLMASPRMPLQPQGFGYLGKELRDTHELLMKADGRPGVPKVAIIISEKKSPDQVELAARVLKSEGVEVFAVGLGAWFSPSQLEAMSSRPIREHVLYGDFKKWKSMARQIILSIFRKYFDREHMNDKIRKEVFGSQVS